MPVDCRFAGHQHGSGPVIDPGGVAGGDGAAVPERGRQAGQLVQGRAPGMLIGIHP